MLKRVLELAGGLAVILVLVVLFNVSFGLTQGDPRVPPLQDQWWAGYVIVPPADTSWILARFHEARPGAQLRLAFVTGAEEVFVLQGTRSSSDATFVEYDLQMTAGPTRLRAKQLYEGKRYLVQRLLSGRFGDFWRKNADLAIRGQLAGGPTSVEFAVEPIDSTRVDSFYRTLVTPGAARPIAEVGLALEVALGN